MNRQTYLLHPLLFAVMPVLSIAGNNPGQYRWSDFFTVVASVLVIVAVILVVVLLTLQLRQPPDRAGQSAALVVTLAVAWCFYYPPLQQLFVELTWVPAHRLVALSLGVLVSAAALLLTRRPAALPTVNRTLTVAAALLVGMGVLQLAANQARTVRTVRASRLVRLTSAPVPIATLPPGRKGPKRDIYLVVLDNRANSTVMREVLDFDDTAFEDSLRALGFVIPRDMQSNYTHTLHSVTSLLNFEHVTQLTEDAGPRNPDFSIEAHLVAHNRAARFLKAQGYRYVFFPSAWWSLTADSPIADEEFRAVPGVDLPYSLWRTQLRYWVIRSSLLRNVAWLQADRVTDPRHYLRTFEGLKQVPADTAPTFAFAHLLITHGPFLLDSTCAPSARPVLRITENNSPRTRAAYLQQLRCADRLVLDLVTTVLRRSPTPPIIIVVGDHGSRFSDPHFFARPQRASVALTRERFGAFGAFYLPAGGDSLFKERVTLVNVLRNVFRYYFGAELPPVPNQQFVTGWKSYKFYPRDTLGSATAAVRVAR